MVKQPKRFQPSKVSSIQNNLRPLLENVQIEIGQATEEPVYLKGPELLLQALRGYAYKSKLVAKYLEAYSLLNNPLHAEMFPELVNELGEWRQATEDEICAYCGLDPGEFIGQCIAALYNYGLEQANLLVRVSAPEVVRAAIASAKIVGKDGAPDRKLLLEAAKVVEPAGALVSIDQRSVTVNNNYPGQSAGLPAWPGLAKNDGLESKQLAATTTENIIEGELVTPEVELVPS